MSLLKDIMSRYFVQIYCLLKQSLVLEVLLAFDKANHSGPPVLWAFIFKCFSSQVENAYSCLTFPNSCTSSNHRSTFIYVITWERCRAHKYHPHIFIRRDQAKIFLLRFWYFHLGNSQISKHRICKISTFFIHQDPSFLFPEMK